jgi:hypothetical protein
VGTTRRHPAGVAEAEAFFDGSVLGLAAYRTVQGLLDEVGPCDLRVTRTQVGWARRRGFAFLWLPGRWLRNAAAEVVLTIASDHRIESSRWKEVVEVRPGLVTHHLELYEAADLDTHVADWLADAYRAAG